MKILIVEDEPIIAADLRVIVEKLGHEVLEVFDSVEEAIPFLFNQSPDLVLLDVHLSGKLDGIHLAELLHSKYKIPFIFITSFVDQVTIERAKNTQPSAYIAKPFQENNLKANIELALMKSHFTEKPNANQSPGMEKVFVKHKHELIALSPTEITHLEAYDNYTYVFRQDKKYLLSHTLKSIEEKLQPWGFLRVHKSYLVNLMKITSIQEGYVFINQEKIPLGKAYKSDFMKAITVL